MKIFFFKFFLPLIQIVGIILFVPGACGVFNEGFRGEIPAAPYFFIIGLVLLFGVWVVQRRVLGNPKQNKEK